MILLCRLFLLLVVSVAAAGCVTYSPFLNLPSEQIRKSGGEIGGSLSALTQTGSTGDVNAGVEGFVRYGFAEKFALGVRTWTDDLDWTDDFSLNGFSVDALLSLSDTAQSIRYALAPRTLFLFEDRTLRALAVTVDGVAWLPKLWILKPYASIGGGIGQDLEPADEEPDFVYAAMAHLGTSVDLFGNFSARGEFASVTEFDGVEGFRRWFVVPSLSFVWEF